MELTHRHPEVAMQAFEDVREFYGDDRVQFSDLWRRYNHRAVHTEDVEPLPSDQFRDVLKRMNERDLVKVDAFGIWPTEA